MAKVSVVLKGNPLAVVACLISFIFAKISIIILYRNGPLHDFDQFLEVESQMDAEVISASILREALFAGAITMHEVKSRIGTSTAHLLHESLRIKNFPSKVEYLHDESASALRKYCLTYYVIRAAILELGLKLDTMRNLDYLLRYHQQMISLEVLKHMPLLLMLLQLVLYHLS